MSILTVGLRQRSNPGYERRLATTTRACCDDTSDLTLAKESLAGMRPLGSANYVSADDERGLSARTVRYTHVVLRSALLQALHWRLLIENPADRVKLPQQPRCEMRALTLEQARTSLKAALATPYGPMLAVALTTGMRPSEYLGLECQDINWERQTVSVHSVRCRDGRWRLTDTKRPRSRRLIRTPHNN